MSIMGRVAEGGGSSRLLAPELRSNRRVVAVGKMGGISTRKRQKRFATGANLYYIKRLCLGDPASRKKLARSWPGP